MSLVHPFNAGARATVCIATAWLCGRACWPSHRYPHVVWCAPGGLTTACLCPIFEHSCTRKRRRRAESEIEVRDRLKCAATLEWGIIVVLGGGNVRQCGAMWGPDEIQGSAPQTCSNIAPHSRLCTPNLFKYCPTLPH